MGKHPLPQRLFFTLTLIPYSIYAVVSHENVPFHYTDIINNHFNNTPTITRS